MLELWLLPGGHNLLHHSYFSIAVSAWFEITPGVGEHGTKRQTKSNVLGAEMGRCSAENPSGVPIWCRGAGYPAYLVPKRMKKTLLVKIGASFTVSPGRGAW
jgi:hypothetical protein